MTVSVLTLTFISIDRWYAICYPLRYKPQPERAWCIIAFIWIAGFVFDLPELLVLHTTTIKKFQYLCNFQLNFENFQNFNNCGNFY